MESPTQSAADAAGHVEPAAAGSAGSHCAAGAAAESPVRI